MGQIRSTPRRLLSNIGGLAAGNIGAAACSYLASVYLARRLGRDVFGLFTYGQTVAAYAMVAADLGFSPYSSRALAKDGRLIENSLTSIVLSQACAGLAILLCMFFGSMLFPPWRSSATSGVVIGSSVAAVLYPFAFDWYYLGNEQIRVFSISKLLQALAILVGAATIVKKPDDVLVASLLRAGSFVVACLWLVRNLPRTVRFTFKLDFASTWLMFKTSAKWFWLSAMLVQLSSGLDIIMLQAFGKTADLGLYSVGFRTNALLVLGISVVNTSMLPILTHESQATEQRFREAVKHYALVATAVALGFVILSLFFAHLVIVLTYGPTYRAAGLYLRLLLLGSAAFAVNGAIAQPLLATGRERAVTLQVAVTAVLCFIGNLICIPTFGALGACYVFIGVPVVGTIWLLPSYRSLMRHWRIPRPLGLPDDSQEMEHLA